MATILKADAAPPRVDRTKQPEPELTTNPILGERYWSKDFMVREWDKIWIRA
jgi:hypothetical protein